MSVVSFLKRTFGRTSDPTKHITPDFLQLNVDWNAEPNAPDPRVTLIAGDILLAFDLNAFVHKQFTDGERGTLRFTNCSRYRLGSTNDEGWYRGQCRYSNIAPRWGEFYELVGDDPLRDQPGDWRAMGGSGASRHFLFYFRDQTFECLADDWLIEIDEANPLRRANGDVSR